MARLSFLAVAATALLVGAHITSSAAHAQTPVATVGIDHDRGAPDVNAGPAYAASNALASVALVLADIPNDPGVNFWDIRVHYDSAVISPIACETPFTNNSFCITTLPGTVRVLAVRVIPLEGTLVISDIAFEAVGAPGTCSNLSIEIDELSGHDGTPITASPADGQICISASIAPQQATAGIDHTSGNPTGIDSGPLSVPIDYLGAFSVAVDSPLNGVSFAIVNVAYDDTVFEVASCSGATVCFATGPPAAVSIVASGSFVPFRPQRLGGVSLLPLGEVGDCSPLIVTAQAFEDLLDQPLGSATVDGEACITGTFFPTPTPTPGPSPGTTPRPPAVGGIAGLAAGSNAQQQSTASAVPLSFVAIAAAVSAAATLTVLTTRHSWRKRR